MPSKKHVFIVSSAIAIAAAFGGMLWTIARLTDNNDIYKKYMNCEEGEQTDVEQVPQESTEQELDEAILRAASTRRFSSTR